VERARATALAGCSAPTASARRGPASGRWQGERTAFDRSELAYLVVDEVTDRLILDKVP